MLEDSSSWTQRVKMSGENTSGHAHRSHATVAYNRSVCACVWGGVCGRKRQANKDMEMYEGGKKYRVCMHGMCGEVQKFLPSHN